MLGRTSSPRARIQFISSDVHVLNAGSLSAMPTP